MPTHAPRRCNLPSEATSFIGRRDEMAQTRAKLTAARLVTLVGPGGVGKTRLAIRMASDLGRGFPDGAWLVELAELRDPGLVGNTVLAALDLRDQAATEPVTLLCSYLEDKRLLLVLDNCEHLVDAAAQLVNDVLKAAPAVRVVATSREPLSVEGEHVLPVPPLPLPPPNTDEPLDRLQQNEAIMLFVERAAAASGSFELTVANKAAVVEVCRRLDGLPLAIELAAVRTRALTPEQIRDRLSARFDLLTGGSRVALPRHQTLRTAIEWSYDLLAPAERRLAARLSVFAGRFTVADVEAVCASEDLPATHMLDLLSSLVDKSLVIADAAAGVGCYRLHETMRAFGRLQLDAVDETAGFEGRCADYYVTTSRQFASEGRYRLPEWLAWMDLEIDNVRAVLRRCLDSDDSQRAIDLATGQVWYWVTRATTEGVRWLDELFATSATTNPWAYFTRGFLAVLQYDPAAGTAALQRGIDVARAADLPDALSQSLAMASITATMSGDRGSSKRLLEEAEAIAKGIDEVGTTLMVHEARALSGLIEGDLDAVVSAATAGAALSREVGDLYSLGMMLMNHGYAALRSDSVGEAEELFIEGLRIASRLDDRVAQCYLLGGVGCCAAGSRNSRIAAQLLGAMEKLRGEVGATLNAGMAPAISHATATATSALGASRFESAYREGQQLSRDAAKRLATREAPATGQAPPGTTAAPPLSRRATEVAQLVAEGLSNKEIGMRLFISERTVESHVRNILNALGFKSRTQIATWVTAARQS